jgi:molecular chaperone DnaK (HSP70)
MHLEPNHKALADANIDESHRADVDEVILVGGATRTPWLRERISAHFGRELCTSVHPDRAVAEGAAVQAAILGGIDNKVG